MAVVVNVGCRQTREDRSMFNVPRQHSRASARQGSATVRHRAKYCSSLSSYPSLRALSQTKCIPLLVFLSMISCHDDTLYHLATVRTDAPQDDTPSRARVCSTRYSTRQCHLSSGFAVYASRTKITCVNYARSTGLNRGMDSTSMTSVIHHCQGDCRSRRSR